MNTTKPNTPLDQIALKLIATTYSDEVAIDVPIRKQKPKTVAVIIKDKGYFEFPLVQEYNSGYVCQTSQGENTMATEWFAKQSLNTNSHIVGE